MSVFLKKQIVEENVFFKKSLKFAVPVMICVQTNSRQGKFLRTQWGSSGRPIQSWRGGCKLAIKLWG